MAAGLFLSVRNDSRIAALTAERDLLAAEIAAQQQAPAGRLETPIATVRVTETVTNNPAGPTVDELLKTLALARVTEAEGPKRIRTLREIVFSLESLVHKGEVAVGPVRAFLAGFEDVDYTGELARREQAEAEAATKAAEMELAMQQIAEDPAASFKNLPREGNPGEARKGGPREGSGRGGRDVVETAMRGIRSAAISRRDRARFDFDFPPTLRAGLLEVLSRIPSSESEVALVEVMRSSAKGFEVAYAARLLESMAAGKYRTEAIAAASELLTNPPDVSGKTRLDQRQKTYLYSVFELYGDSSFTDNAQRLLVDAAGKIDSHAFNFLLGTLKEGALPALFAAFNDPRITNVWSRAAILERSMSYVGKDPSANAMWTTMVGNESLPGQVRAMNIAGLTRGGGRRDSAGSQDLPLLEGRLQLVQQMQATASDQAVVRALGRAAEELQSQITGEPQDRRTRRENRPPGRQSGGSRQPGA